jgi:hypothetical protein
MADRRSRRDPLTSVPEPGREAGPDDTGEGAGAEAATVGRRDGRRVISRLAPSGAGPGAGESEMVRVEAPVKGQEDDDVPRHPTLRDHPGPG